MSVTVVDSATVPLEAAKAVPPRASSGPLAIAATLRNRILTGTYGYGEKMPTERVMAGSFGTSRATLREALRLLEQGGLIHRRVGSGTYVVYQAAEGSGQTEDDVAEITSPLELVEVRAALEPQMVQLAVLNMTAKDIAGLDEAIAALEASGNDAERFTRWDRVFHQRIADGTRNPLYASFYRQINHVRGHAQWSRIKGAVLSPERMAHYNALHRAIYEAIRARDAEAGRRAIESHMAEARTDLLRGGSR
jgi:DNA-binding FadR family transcriptional regulator